MAWPTEWLLYGQIPVNLRSNNEILTLDGRSGRDPEVPSDQSEWDESAGLEMMCGKSPCPRR